MKATAFGILVFFVSLNLSLYVLSETDVLPSYELDPYEEPSGIQLIFVNITAANLLVMGGTSLTIAAIVSVLTGHFIYGGTIGIILFGLQLLFEPVRWVINGFPLFLNQIGVNPIITTIIQTLIAVVYAWFIVGFIGQRSAWEQ